MDKDMFNVKVDSDIDGNIKINISHDTLLERVNKVTEKFMFQPNTPSIMEIFNKEMKKVVDDYFIQRKMIEELKEEE